MEKSDQSQIILIHGLGGSRLDMWPISRKLRIAGFDPITWSYRSLGQDIKALSEKFLQFIRQNLDSNGQQRIHVVTHSMGGIIVRSALSSAPDLKFGRVVMLAPPHGGSHVARRLSPFAGWLTPSLNQLSDDPHSFVNRLPNSYLDRSIEFGIVAASKDRVIHPDKVRLPGLADFAAVHGHHGILPWYRETAELVLSFLQTGSFDLTRQSAE